MIPILYESTETAFASNGIGRLVDCISCIVTEERNGIYECEFKYPVNGHRFGDIQIGRIIAVTHDDQKDIQPFDIYKRSAEIDGVVTFNAHHISYRLGHVILEPYTAATCATALSGISSHSVNTNPFTFWTDKQVSRDFALTLPKPCREVLGGSAGSILDVYGKGEYKFDKWMVRLYLNRGADHGVEIRYGKDLTDLTQDVDATGAYNAVAPYWTDGVESVWLPEYIVTTTPAPARVTPVMLDLSGEFESAPTATELRAKAADALAAQPWLPEESIEVDFAAMWQTEEYQNVAPLQRVGLCDTVTVIFDQIGARTKTKVIRVEYDTLLDRFQRIELGEPKTTFAESIIGEVETAIAGKSVSPGAMQAAIDSATQLITGGLGGHVKINTNADGQPNEILIMDTDDILTAVHVWRFNQNGWGYSSTGYSGPYTLAATIDGGLTADYITTGILNADLMTAGTISDASGANYWDLDAGVFHAENAEISGSLKIGGVRGAYGHIVMYDSNGNLAGRWDAHGLQFNGCGHAYWENSRGDTPTGATCNNKTELDHGGIIFSAARTNTVSPYQIYEIYATEFTQGSPNAVHRVRKDTAVYLIASDTLESGTYENVLTVFPSATNAQAKAVVYGNIQGRELRSSCVRRSASGLIDDGSTKCEYCYYYMVGSLVYVRAYVGTQSNAIYSTIIARGLPDAESKIPLTMVQHHTAYVAANHNFYADISYRSTTSGSTYTITIDIQRPSGYSGWTYYDIFGVYPTTVFTLS